MKSPNVSDKWYYADQAQRIGPLELKQLGKKLIALPNATEVLVWCNRFSDWKCAREVSELREFLVPSGPIAPNWPPKKEDSSDLKEAGPGWVFQWWWVFAGVVIIFLVSMKIVVGNNDGRMAIGREIHKRKAVRRDLKGGPKVLS
jgi:hypothetical protein